MTMDTLLRILASVVFTGVIAGVVAVAVLWPVAATCYLGGSTVLAIGVGWLIANNR